MTERIPFNRPHVTGRELVFIREAVENGHLSGNGPFTRKCQDWLERKTGARKALLTQSCTAGLELAALLADVGPGDEVIMPSFTFVSTANAFALRGATPVFVDIRPDTLNLDEGKLESAINDRTRAIVVVHYAGVGCEMDAILSIAHRHDLLVIEDAAHAIGADYRRRPLGSFGHLATLSFHETKNLVSGEGGALLINDARFVERAEILWEKGTNRAQFFRGEVDKYTWVDVGSSFLPSEITAAFLWAQLEAEPEITAERIELWTWYNELLEKAADRGLLRRPVVPEDCQHNGHLFYLLAPHAQAQRLLLQELRAQGIQAVFHYVPLHSSTAGRRVGRTQGDLTVTVNSSERLIRLPFWIGLGESRARRVVSAVVKCLEAGRAGPPGP